MGKPLHNEKIAAPFFLYGIYNDVVDYIQKYDRFQWQSCLPANVKNEMYSVPVSKHVIKQVGLDLCSLPEMDGNRHLNACIDYFTKWSDAKLIRGKTALTVATFLYELMCRHGCFKVQINDEVREFVSVLCTCLRDLNGVDQCKVYPQYTLNRPYSQYTIRNQMILWRGKTKRQKMPW